jgi:hypothetical protein
MTKVYMEVSQDRFELPVTVADSVAELARITGTSANTISATISRAAAEGVPCKYVVVEIDDTDDDDTAITAKRAKTGGDTKDSLDRIAQNILGRKQGRPRSTDYFRRFRPIPECEDIARAHGLSYGHAEVRGLFSL